MSDADKAKERERIEKDRIVNTDVADMTGDEMGALTQMWEAIEKAHQEAVAEERKADDGEEKDDSFDGSDGDL